MSQTTILCHLFSALQSLSQFGRGRLSLVAISFYALSLLFGSCHLLEFTLTGPRYAIDLIFCCYLFGLWVNTSPFSRISMHWKTILSKTLSYYKPRPTTGLNFSFNFCKMARTHSWINTVSDYKCSHCFRGWIQIATVVVNYTNVKVLLNWPLRPWYSL